MKNLILISSILGSTSAHAAVCTVKYCTYEGRLETKYSYVQYCRSGLSTSSWQPARDTVVATDTLEARYKFIKGYKKALNSEFTADEINTAILSISCKSPEPTQKPAPAANWRRSF